MSYQTARNIAIVMLRDNKHIGESDFSLKLKETLNNVKVLYGDVDFDSLEKDLFAHFNIITQEYKILQEDYLPWFSEARSSIDFRFWKRYKDYLLWNKGMAPDTVDQLDNLTDEIIDRLANPKLENAFDRRGMVVGHVQSGKTSNYTGLICKAADAGFSLIIVLSGIHSSLRSQTHQRIDEGFLGFSTEVQRTHAMATRKLGVSHYDPNPIANSITSSSLDGDFRRATANGIQIKSKEPLIAVVKKNSTILKNLIRWMFTQADIIKDSDGKRVFRNLSLLLIDDEADNATINTSQGNVSAINGQIRALLSLFEQRAYVGYTATPFANIFIPYQNDQVPTGLNIHLDGVLLPVEEDLFPRDFIVNILAPSNYIGPDRIFGLGQGHDQISSEEDDATITVMPLIRQINDYVTAIPNKHKRANPLPKTLPISLIESIRSFLLCTAIRLARGETNFHSSMLIHVTRFTNWQDNIATLVNDSLKVIRDGITTGSVSEFNLFCDLYQRDFVPTTLQFTNNLVNFDDPFIKEMKWEDIKPKLDHVVSKSEVRVVHGPGDTFLSGLAKPLNYHLHDKGLYVIAVGGDKLSRGLTLEGLCVSYFLRASKMYDTLMQMGRWFGYRPGYADICRLYTSEELITWYRHIAIASDEMRLQFDQMALVGRTPKDFGLKVRSLPGILQISSIAKLRYADNLELSYSDTLIETHTFSKEVLTYNNNFNTTTSFLKLLGEPNNKERHYIWFGVPASRVLDFLREYKPNQSQASLNPDKVCDYIEKQVDNGALNNWTIAFINKHDAANKLYSIDNVNSITVGATIRRPDGVNDDPFSHSNYNKKEFNLKKGHIISPNHEGLDLSGEELADAKIKSLGLSQKKWDREKLKKDRDNKQMKEPRPIALPIMPSGPAIRKVRMSSNALLIIYPLDPMEVRKNVNEMAFDNSHPLIGYAISFPFIANDVKVTYVVNNQFMQEYEYPDEFDNYTEDLE